MLNIKGLKIFYNFLPLFCSTLTQVFFWWGELSLVLNCNRDIFISCVNKQLELSYLIVQQKQIRLWMTDLASFFFWRTDPLVLVIYVTRIQFSSFFWIRSLYQVKLPCKTDIFRLFCYHQLFETAGYLASTITLEECEKCCYFLFWVKMVIGDGP